MNVEKTHWKAWVAKKASLCYGYRHSWRTQKCLKGQTLAEWNQVSESDSMRELANQVKKGPIKSAKDVERIYHAFGWMHYMGMCDIQ